MREQIKAHHSRNRVSGKAKEWNGLARPLHFAEDNWSSGLNQCSCEEELSPDFVESLFHQIKLAHRHASGKQQHVGAQAGVNQEEQFAWLVGRDGKTHRLATRALNLRCQRVTVAVAN